MDRPPEAKRQGRRRKIPVFALVAGLALLLALGLAGYRVLETQVLYPLRYAETVERWAAEYDVDPYLVYAVVRTESSFDPLAESSAGARGLMQMTEETFEWIKAKIAPGEDLGFDDLYAPEVAIRFGACLLAMSLERYGGDVSTAAAAYHSGWGTVDRLLEDSAYSGNGVTLDSFPHRQMNHYVNKVNRYYDKYLELYA